MELEKLPLRVLPLQELHKQLGGKLVPFAGWNMPVQYVGIKEEHNAVRESAGIFDVSHMGELLVRGTDALDFLNYISTNDVSKTIPGKAQYGLVLNQAGGVIDDIIVYRLSEHDYFVCANASNVDTIYEWFVQKQKEGKILKKGNDSVAPEAKPFDCTIENVSTQYAQFAVQGPLAMKVLEQYFGSENTNIKRFSFSNILEYTKPDLPCLLARTGYSGEDGCEVFLPVEYAEQVWSGLFNAAETAGIPLVPCGLGARDTLRLEACLPLHGHEIREDITPLSAALDRFVSFEKGYFIGRAALEQQKQIGINPVLIGIEVEGQGIIRAEYPVLSSGKTVGWVTSGTKTPTLNKAIGLALVLPDYATEEKELTVKVRDKDLPVKKVSLPFYKKK